MLLSLTLRRAALSLGALVLSLAAPTSAVAQTATPHAADKELVTFGVGPGGQAHVDQRSFLSYTARPGSQLSDKVAVFNQSDQPLDLLVYPSDGTTAKDGSLALRPRAERNTGFGAWVALGADATTARVARDARSMVRVTVPAQSPTKGIGKVVVPMRLIVPTDAAPGDHVAGVVAALVSKGANATSQNIELEQRVALRVFLRVAGEVKAGLAVKILKAEYFGGSGLGLAGITKVTYRVTNTGHVRLAADTRVSVKSPLGLGTTVVDGPSLSELVPGGRAEVTAEVKDTPPSVIQHATVTVTAKAAVGGQPVKIAPVSDHTRLWAITWQEVALVMIIVVGIVLRRWRKARRPQPRHVAAHDVRSSPAVVVSVVLLVGAAVVVVAAAGVARAAVLGRVAVSPTVGDDQTLFDGSVVDARCPKGTVDSFFTVDGPGLAPNLAFLGPGSPSGRGTQVFRSASIANIRATNSSSFLRDGTFAIRFSCVDGSGEVVDSYQRLMDYEAGGQGRYRLRGYPASSPTRFPVPGITYSVEHVTGPDAPHSVPSATGQSASGAPEVLPSASPSSSARALAPVRDAEAVGASTRSWPLGLAGAALAVAGGLVLVRRRRRRDLDLS